MTRTAVRSGLVFLVLALGLSPLLGGCGGGETGAAGEGRSSAEAGALPGAQKEGETMTKTVEFAVTGMHCDGCVRAIHTVVSEKDGVVADSVSLEEERAVVTFDPEKVKESDIVAAIEELGYKAEPKAERAE